MSPTRVLDQYYLAITLLVTVGYQLLGFAIAWTFQVPLRLSRRVYGSINNSLTFLYIH
jgi:hypothetical protein